MMQIRTDVGSHLKIEVRRKPYSLNTSQMDRIRLELLSANDYPFFDKKKLKDKKVP